MPPKIDYSKCIACKKCYDLCPMDVYVWDEELGLPKVGYPEVCWHEGICYMECPERCIDLRYPPSLW